jgi:hypothetical protein
MDETFIMRFALTILKSAWQNRNEREQTYKWTH